MTINNRKLAALAILGVVSLSSLVHMSIEKERMKSREVLTFSSLVSPQSNSIKRIITVKGTSFSEDSNEYSISGYRIENGQVININLFYRGDLAKTLEERIRPFDNIELEIDTSKVHRKLLYDEGEERKSLDFYELKPDTITSRNYREEKF